MYKWVDVEGRTVTEVVEELCGELAKPLHEGGWAEGAGGLGGWGAGGLGKGVGGVTVRGNSEAHIGGNSREGAGAGAGGGGGGCDLSGGVPVHW